MNMTTIQTWIITSIFVLASSGLALADGLEATEDGTPIDLSSQVLGDAAELTDGLLRVTGTTGQQATLHLFDLEAPVVDSDAYAISGEVYYEGVEGDGFLEMWNHMPAEKGGSEIAQSFFSRTMDVSGPLAKLTGNSDWRAFRLPAFINDGSGRRPLKLTLNVVLPGEGIVEVRNLKLKTLPMPVAMNRGAGRSLVVVSIISIAIGAALVCLIWYLKKCRSDSELRRIQALDS